MPPPNPTFVPGFNRATTFAPDGSPGVLMFVTGWSWQEEVEKLVTTHTGTQGFETVLAGILKGDGHVDANINAAQMPASGLGIRAGAKGTIVCDAGGGPISIHVMITKVTYRSAVQELVKYGFDCCLDATTGTYLLP